MVTDLGNEAINLAAELIMRFEAGDELTATEHAVVAFLIAAAHQARVKDGQR